MSCAAASVRTVVSTPCPDACTCIRCHLRSKICEAKARQTTDPPQQARRCAPAVAAAPAVAVVSGTVQPDTAQCPMLDHQIRFIQTHPRYHNDTENYYVDELDDGYDNLDDGDDNLDDGDEFEGV